jgi:hypothetical protein
MIMGHNNDHGGPFPAGAWPDLNIAHNSLIHFLDDGEYYAADGGYADGNQWSSTPNGLHDYEQRTKALACAHHETVNRRLKSLVVCRNNTGTILICTKRCAKRRASCFVFQFVFVNPGV